MSHFPVAVTWGSFGRRLTRAASLVAVTASLVACNLQLSTGIEAKSGWSRTYKVAAGATLEIREPNGRITIEAIDGSEIQVSATRVAKAATEEAAKAAAEKVQINEKVSADRVELDSTAGQNSGFMSTSSQHVDYDVKVPRSIHLSIKATNSKVDVKSVTGTLRIEAVNGEIVVDGAEQGADINTVNGRVVLNMAKIGADGARVKTVNGEIEVGVPTGGKATIAARVSNGAVEVQGLELKTSEKSYRRLDATLGGGGPEIRLDTTNGVIKIVGR
jgi:DUF4097 and DUF4098 domain-containing protein YvlB